MTPFPDSDPGTVVQPCTAKNNKPTHWIEIELVGEDGLPIPDAAYLIVLPGGDTVRGFLDGKGAARVASIPDAGECQVTFPEIDQDAWSSLS